MSGAFFFALAIPNSKLWQTRRTCNPGVTASITQTGAATFGGTPNIASISQTGNGFMASISQVGGGNNAAVIQR